MASRSAVIDGDYDEWVQGRRWNRLTTWLLEYVVTNNLGMPEEPVLGRKLLLSYEQSP